MSMKNIEGRKVAGYLFFTPKCKKQTFWKVSHNIKIDYKNGKHVKQIPVTNQCKTIQVDSSVFDP